jgi:hypothetical protein
MAERSINIPSNGQTTPEYNAVQKSYGEINSAIIREDFVSRAHSCELIPTRNPSSRPLDVVLDEISRDPVNYYSLQYVLATLNEGNRFEKGIGRMKKTFQCKDITVPSRRRAYGYLGPRRGEGVEDIQSISIAVRCERPPRLITHATRSLIINPRCRDFSRKFDQGGANRDFLKLRGVNKW